jgi:hypothetical protein
MEQDAYADRSGETQDLEEHRPFPGQHTINHVEELVHMPDKVGWASFDILKNIKPTTCLPQVWLEKNMAMHLPCFLIGTEE